MPELPRYHEVVGAWLNQAPLLHNQLIGMIGHALDGRYEQLWALSVHDAHDAICAAAVCTAPRPLVLSSGPEGAMHALAADLHQRQIALSGVVASESGARAFEAAWCELARVRSRVMLPLRLYQCERVVMPEGVPGSPRRSRAEDALLLLPWMREFERETGTRSGGQLEGEVPSRCERGDFLIWEVDEVPVSCAAVVRRSEATASVSYVYTPPGARGRGFGAAVTAALTAALLESGLSSANLFADQRNATTNKIYQQIGYQRVAELLHLSFEA
jgi:predicted GNAT family acetyltransferase